MVRILITGGACAGKTEIIEAIKNNYQNKEYNVFVLNEIPTQLIANGVTFKKIGKMKFIELVIKIYLELDNNYNSFIANNSQNIIVYDGTPLDMLKFISKKEFDKIAAKYNTSFDKIINCYDKIIFLETIAKKYPQFYTLENNRARLNDVNMAVKRNDILAGYYESANHIYIEGCLVFTEKKDKVLKIIDETLEKITIKNE